MNWHLPRYNNAQQQQEQQQEHATDHTQLRRNIWLP